MSIGKPRQQAEGRRSCEMFKPFLLTAALVPLASSSALSDVFVYEGDVLPVPGGFVAIQIYCDPETWNSNGFLYEHVDMCEAGGGDQTNYRRSILDFFDTGDFFAEWRMETDGSSDQVIHVAPAAIVWDGDGVDYHFVIARDLVKLNRDNLLPLVITEIEPGVPHVYRLELENGATPWYRYYIDHELIDEGEAEGAYPTGTDPRLFFRAWAYSSPSTTQWDYIRWGNLQTVKGDFDSDGIIGASDVDYFEECLLGPEIQALPGCAWADFNDDTYVDCADRDAFQTAWNDTGDPPPLIFCNGAIPATSQWGLAALALLTLTAGTLAFRRVPRAA